MADNTTQVGDQTTTGSAGGDGDQTNTDTSGAGGGGGTGASGDSVSYDSHRRLLSEKKRVQAERDELKQQLQTRLDAEAEAEKKRLEDQGEYKKLLENERKAKAELEAKLTRHTETQREAKKLGAVIDALDNKVDKKFWRFLDTSGVVIDPETGELDAMSVQKAVDGIRKEFPEFIRTGTNGGTLPADAAQSGNIDLSNDDAWKNLPLEKQRELLPERVKALKAQVGMN
jgi:hypothetical protein